MEEFNFINNAGEEFKFFLDEYDNPCLNIRHEKELIACFILSKHELTELTKFLTELK